MFSFMKKDKEKKDKQDKKKKEKDEKQDKKERQNMTPEDLSRIEEMKKGMQRRSSDRDKKRGSQKSAHQSSPTGSEDAIDSASSAHSSPTKEPKPLVKPQPLPRQHLLSSSLRKEPPPAIMPKPKIKSILKDKGDVIQSFSSSVNLDDSKLLQENTKCNEDLFTEQTQISQTFLTVTSSTTLMSSTTNGDCRVSEEESIKPRPFESKLKLPAIIQPKPPRVREIAVQRMQSGGFGFSLRKGLIPEPGGGSQKAVTFAEPGSGSSITQSGLLPGDKLVEINGKKRRKHVSRRDS